MCAVGNKHIFLLTVWRPLPDPALMALQETLDLDPRWALDSTRPHSPAQKCTQASRFSAGGQDCLQVVWCRVVALTCMCKERSRDRSFCAPCTLQRCVACPRAFYNNAFTSTSRSALLASQGDTSTTWARQVPFPPAESSFCRWDRESQRSGSAYLFRVGSPKCLFQGSDRLIPPNYGLFPRKGRGDKYKIRRRCSDTKDALRSGWLMSNFKVTCVASIGGSSGHVMRKVLRSTHATVETQRCSDNLVRFRGIGVFEDAWGRTSSSRYPRLRYWSVQYLWISTAKCARYMRVHQNPPPPPETHGFVPKTIKYSH